MIICAPKEISYTLGSDGRSITFHPCGVTSFNRNDIEQRYCMVCHRFMDLVDLAKELSREIEGNGDLHDQ